MRTIGKAKAFTAIGLRDLAYNITQLSLLIDAIRGYMPCMKIMDNTFPYREKGRQGKAHIILV